MSSSYISKKYLREKHPWRDSECKILVRCAIERKEALDIIADRHLRSPESLKNKLIYLGECNTKFVDTSNNSLANLGRPRPKELSDKELRELWDRELPDNHTYKESYSEHEVPSIESGDWAESDDFDCYDWEHFMGGCGID